CHQPGDQYGDLRWSSSADRISIATRLVATTAVYTGRLDTDPPRRADLYHPVSSTYSRLGGTKRRPAGALWSGFPAVSCRPVWATPIRGRQTGATATEIRPR